MLEILLSLCIAIVSMAGGAFIGYTIMNDRALKIKNAELQKENTRLTAINKTEAELATQAQDKLNKEITSLKQEIVGLEEEISQNEKEEQPDDFQSVYQSVDNVLSGVIKKEDPHEKR